METIACRKDDPQYGGRAVKVYEGAMMGHGAIDLRRYRLILADGERAGDSSCHPRLGDDREGCRMWRKFVFPRFFIAQKHICLRKNVGICEYKEKNDY